MRRVVCVPLQGEMRRQGQGLIPVTLFFAHNSKPSQLDSELPSIGARARLGACEPRGSTLAWSPFPPIPPPKEGVGLALAAGALRTLHLGRARPGRTVGLASLGIIRLLPPSHENHTHFCLFSFEDGIRIFISFCAVSPPFEDEDLRQMFLTQRAQARVLTAFELPSAPATFHTLRSAVPAARAAQRRAVHGGGPEH